MAEIVNLRLARKKKARADKESRAPKTGSPSAARRPSATRSKAESEIAQRRLDLHKRDDERSDGDQVATASSSAPSPSRATAPASRSKSHSGTSCAQIAEREAISVQRSDRAYRRRARRAEPVLRHPGFRAQPTARGSQPPGTNLNSRRRRKFDGRRRRRHHEGRRVRRFRRPRASAVPIASARRRGGPDRPLP